MSTPLLVVVTGMPGAGKTTLGRALSKELRLPLITKDEIKEQLYDTIGVGDSDWSGRLGGAAYELIFVFCRELLAVGQSVIAEANFFAGSHERQFLALPRHRVAQIHCHAPLEVILQRYASRSDRHPGHLDNERVGGLAQREASGVHSALALAGDIIEVDTSQRVDGKAIAARLNSERRN